MTKAEMQVRINALTEQLAVLTAAPTATVTTAAPGKFLVAAQREGEVHYEYMTTRAAAFFKAKALAKSGWKVTKGLYN